MPAGGIGRFARRNNSGKLPSESTAKQAKNNSDPLGKQSIGSTTDFSLSCGTTDPKKEYIEKRNDVNEINPKQTVPFFGSMQNTSENFNFDPKGHFGFTDVGIVNDDPNDFNFMQIENIPNKGLSVTNIVDVINFKEENNTNSKKIVMNKDADGEKLSSTQTECNITKTGLMPFSKSNKVQNANSSNLNCDSQLQSLDSEYPEEKIQTLFGRDLVEEKLKINQPEGGNEVVIPQDFTSDQTTQSSKTSLNRNENEEDQLKNELNDHHKQRDNDLAIESSKLGSLDKMKNDNQNLAHVAIEILKSSPEKDESEERNSHRMYPGHEEEEESVHSVQTRDEPKKESFSAENTSLLGSCPEGKVSKGQETLQLRESEKKRSNSIDTSLTTIDQSRESSKNTNMLASQSDTPTETNNFCEINSCTADKGTSASLSLKEDDIHHSPESSQHELVLKEQETIIGEVKKKEIDDVDKLSPLMKRTNGNSSMGIHSKPSEAKLPNIAIFDQQTSYSSLDSQNCINSQKKGIESEQQVGSTCFNKIDEKNRCRPSVEPIMDVKEIGVRKVDNSESNVIRKTLMAGNSGSLNKMKQTHKEQGKDGIDINQRQIQPTSKHNESQQQDNEMLVEPSILTLNSSRNDDQSRKAINLVNSKKRMSNDARKYENMQKKLKRTIPLLGNEECDSFDDLLTKFLIAFRDGSELYENLSKNLVDLEVDLMRSHSTTLQYFGQMMDLNEEIGDVKQCLINAIHNAEQKL